MLTYLLFCITVCLIFIYYLFDALGNAVIVFSTVLFFFYVVPVVIIHLNYYKNDNNTTYEFTSTGLTQKGEKQVRHIEIAEVIQIDFFYDNKQA